MSKEKQFATDRELELEYDDFYEANPKKWTGKARNLFMVNILSDLIRTPNTVLDVGCGNGHTLARLRRAWGEDVELHGLDLSRVAIRLAKAKVEGLHTHREFIERFDPGMKFDLVLCMGTAEHFRDLEAGLSKLRDLIAPGGHVYLEIPNCLSYSPGEETYRRLSVGSHQWEWHLPRERWTAMLNQAGFDIQATINGRHPAWEFIWILGAK